MGKAKRRRPRGHPARQAAKCADRDLAHGLRALGATEDDVRQALRDLQSIGFIRYEELPGDLVRIWPLEPPPHRSGAPFR